MNRDVKLQIKSRTAGKRRLYYVLLWIGCGVGGGVVVIGFVVILGFLAILGILVILGFLGYLGCLEKLEYLEILGCLDRLGCLESLEPLALACHFPRVSQHHQKPCER